MTLLALSLFGPPQLMRGGEAIQPYSRKCMALLAYLAVTDATHRRAMLGSLLWPQADAARARGSLRSALSALRRTLDGAWLVAGGQTVGLDGNHRGAVDVLRFRDLLSQWRRHGHPPGETCAECWPLLVEAADLCQADFMAGFTLRDSPAFDDWQALESQSLHRELAAVLEPLVAGHAARGNTSQGVVYAQRWVALDPLDETPHRALMRLYAASGQQAAALHQYEACQRILREALGVAPGPETTALRWAIAEGRAPRWQAGPPAPRHSLPPQPTSFVGRAPELARVAELLADPACRLLTVLGPGGVGKSRLAIQAAAAQVQAFTDGVWFVPLASLSSADLLASTILEMLPDTSHGTVEPRAQLLNVLRERHLLLVLDNFEHLPEGAGLVAQMLDAAPGLKVLVTSRRRLSLRGEWLFPLRGMRFPSRAIPGDSERPDLAMTVEGLAAYSAVQLFAACARRVRPDFSLTGAEAYWVARICQLVEGMPLAIELAAPWVRLMPCREIAGEIEGKLDLLSTSLQDMPERHQSMRAVFDHSWRLLSAEERDILAQLSVFRGGFRREAGESVTGAPLRLLSALVDKSWLRATPSGRYEMHELIRQYGLEQLAAEDSAGAGSEKADSREQQARDRHSRYYTGRLAALAVRLKGPGQREALQEVLADIDNMRSSWRWAIRRGDAEAIDRSVDALWYASDLRGWHVEARDSFGAAAARLGAKYDADGAGHGDLGSSGLGMVLARVLARQGHQCNRLGLREQAVALCEESLALLSQAEPSAAWQSDCAYTKLVLGWTLLGCGEVPRARRLFQEALLHAEAVGDPWHRAYILGYLGEAARLQGEYSEGERLLTQSIGVADQVGDLRCRAMVLLVRGRLACARGQYQQAQALAREQLYLLQGLGDPVGTTYALLALGRAATLLGDYSLARRCYRDSLASARETDSVSYFEAMALTGRGVIALAQGRYEDARRIFTDAVRICDDIRVPDVWVRALRGLGEVSCLLGEFDQSGTCFRRALGIAMDGGCVNQVPDVLVGLADLLGKQGQPLQAANLLGLIENQAISSQSARDRAGHLFATISSDLPPDLLAAARARAQGRNLGDVVAEILGQHADPSSDQ